MKKVALTFLLLLSALCVWAEFNISSEEMIERFYKEVPLNTNSAEYKYWENTDVYYTTYGVGNDISQLFGHSAIEFDYPEDSFFYGYGHFTNFDNYEIRFIQAKLDCDCYCEYFNYEIEKKAKEKRTISRIKLDLTPEKKKALSNFLEINSLPEYSNYYYNNLYDNCASRIRDILGVISDGDFKEWAMNIEGYTYREEVGMDMRSVPLIRWICGIVEGPAFDEKASAWDQMFLPKNIEKYLLEYKKLGTEFNYLLDFRSPEEQQVERTPDYQIGLSLLIGIILVGVAVCARHFQKPGLYKGWTFSIDLILGLIGIIMGYMMFFSLHNYCYNNENFLYINPLLIICAVLAFSRKRVLSRVKNIIHIGLAGLLCLLVVLKVILPNVFFQFNWPQIICFLPYYVFVAVCCIKDYNKC